MTAQEVDRFVAHARVFSRQEVLVRPSPVPARPGAYGWWFRRWPSLVVADGCCHHQGLALLYAGISPDQPPRNGRPASKQNLAKRIRYHYTGNAEGSTLRKTLGCLLADELGIQLRRLGSGNRMTFGTGEQALSAWMAENAFVSWVAREAPWELEDELIGGLDLPLNLKGNQRNPFHPVLTQVRARCVAQARALPVLANTGIGEASERPVPAGICSGVSRESPGLLVIVPCGLRKIWDKYPEAGPTAAADAYIGPPFKVNRRYAERADGDWVVLSAKYGFLRPTDVVPGPYNTTFKSPSTNPIGVAALREQVEQMGLNRYSEVVGLGGQDYLAAIQAAFEGTRARLSFPFAGLPMFKALGATKRATLL
jgi:hypothetical protein